MLLSFWISAVSVFASSNPSSQPSAPTIKIIENKGQWEPHILFKANIPSGDLFITKNELVYAMVDAEALHKYVHKETSNQTVKGHNYKMTFRGASANIDVTKLNPSTETYNYFIGNDAQKWASSCRAYEKIVLHNMYHNIDVEIVAKSDYLKINYIIKPGANASDIQLIYTGADQLSLVESALHIKTSVANIKEEKPYAFQANRTIDCAYTLKDSTIGYQLGQYNRHLTMVIDPNIIFGTYSGSVADNFGFTATYDDAGNGYTAGTVYSAGFPVTFGAYLQNFQGGSGFYPNDMGILKFSADGKQLLYATYLGGTNNERPHSIVCNGASELYILGTTESNNFPVTATAFDKFHGGKSDMIIAQLSSNGTQLRACTYWGGTEDDGINGANHEVYLYDSVTSPLAYNYGDFYRGEIKLDKFGNVFIVSTTQSTTDNDYTISNGFQNTFGGGRQDGCIVKFTSNLSTVLLSSYLGGAGDDAIYGITFDASNNIIVTGGTNSSNIGINQGTLTYNGGIDGFVGKINGLGTTLQKLVYIGTSQYDQAYFVDIDNQNKIYISGQSVGNYPVKGNVYSTPNGHQFISILNNGLDSFLYSTVFGNGASGVTLSPSALMVDYCGRVYFSGWGGNTNLVRQRSASNTLGLATTADAFQQLSNGSDFYIIVLDKNLSKLRYATYLGGLSSDEHVDGGTSRFNKNGEIYQAVCASCRSSSDLPTTPGAYSLVNKAPGGCNNALFRFAADPSDNPPIVKDTFIQIIAGDSAYYQYTIIDPDGDSVNAVVTSNIFTLPQNPAVLKTSKGKNSVTVSIAWRTSCSSVSTDTFVVKVVASDNGCLAIKSDSSKIKILIKAPPILNPPFLECLKTINDSVLEVKWTPISLSPYFKSYEIYKSKNGNAFSKFQSKTSIANSSIVDDSAQQHLTQNTCYFIQVVNSCNAASFSSRTVCSVISNDTATFNFTKDTTLTLIATDTLSYTFNVTTTSPSDSVYIHQLGGTLLNTNRIIESNIVNQTQAAQYTFKWKSLCDDVHKDTFRLNIMIRDNQCPQARTNIAHIKIVVTPPPVFDPPPMQCTRSIDNQTVLVRWGKTSIDSRFFSHYVLIRKNANGTITPLTSSYHKDAFTYTDNQAFNNTTDNICYAAYAVNICNEFGDTSNEVCTVFNDEQKPKPLSIYTTTVVDNKNVLTTWAKTTETNFLAYKVYRQVALSETDFSEYATFENQNDTQLVDENVAVQKNSYCYRIKQLNDCGLTNEQDYLACSILLTGKSNPFTHQLKWSDYDYFKQGLDNYSTLRSEPETNFTVVAQTGYKQNRLADDHLNKQNGLYYYQIIAKEINSPFVSTSNTIELIQSPLLHVPNAFSPNDDGNNDIWYPVPVFVKDYHLKLYDRWGKLVFETQSKTEGFNGIIESSIAPSDVFVYLITYTGWDGSSTSVNGNVTLIR